MEIGLIAYALYASFILIWCSVSEEWLKATLISPSRLQDWRESRSDMILFELHPEGASPPTAAGDDFLSVTPASLPALLDWIPPGSTVVFCNRGVSSPSIQSIQQRLILRNISRVYWLDEVRQPTIGGTSVMRL